MKMINRYGGLALAGCLVVLILAAANTAHAASDLDQALTSLARQLVPQGGKPLAVAVADPAGPGKHLSKFSLAVSRGLGHALIKAGIGTVLERKRLNDILEEQQLELSGALDVNLKTMAPLHKKQGVQGLVFSTLDDREGGLEMAARLVEVETGGTLASGRVWLAKTRWMRAALSETLRADLSVTAKPVPPGAVLRVAGEVRSLTNRGVMLKGLPQGRHDLVIEAPCLIKTYTWPFDLNRDRAVSITLNPRKASLELLVNPPNARVSVDGDPGAVKLDTSGAGTVRLPGGKHTITAMAPGHPPLIRSVDLEWCRNHPLSIDLTEHEYELTLRATPKEARVSLDGAPLKLDAAGALRLKLKRGKHIIKAGAADHLPYERVIELHQDMDLPLALKPEPVRVEFQGIYQDPANMAETKTLKEGSAVRGGWYYAIALKASKRAYVYAFQLDSSGNLSRLFPRPQFPGLRNPVEPERWIWSPPREYRSKLDRVNKGPEAIYVVASPVKSPKLEGLMHRLKELRQDPGLLATARQEALERNRDQGGVVQAPKTRTVFGQDLFDAARRLLDESGGQVREIRFEHK